MFLETLNSLNPSPKGQINVYLKLGTISAIILNLKVCESLKGQNAENTSNLGL